MDLAEADELGALQSGDQAQDARLFTEFQVVLKPDQVEAGGAQVLLPKLDDGPRTPARARIGKAHGLHGPEAQRVPSTARDLLNGQARFKIRGVVLSDVRIDALRLEQLVDKALVLFLVEGTVQV